MQINNDPKISLVSSKENRGISSIDALTYISKHNPHLMTFDWKLNLLYSWNVCCTEFALSLPGAPSTPNVNTLTF